MPRSFTQLFTKYPVLFGAIPLSLSFAASSSNAGAGGFCEPTLVNTLETGGGQTTHGPMRISGDLLLTRSGNYDILQVYTLASPGSPTAPVLLAELLSPMFVPAIYSIATDGDVAIIGGSSESWLVDLSDPSVPVAVGLGGSSQNWVVAVEGNVAVVGPSVWDISDRSNPEYLGEIDSGPGTVIHNSIAYKSKLNQVQSWDLSDPANPVLLDEHAEGPVGGATYWDLVVEGDRLYITSGVGGIRVWDISDPSDLQFIGAAPALNSHTLDVVGNIVYCAPLALGEFRALDFTTPGPDVPIVASAPLSVGWGGVRARDGYVYISNGNPNVVSIFDMSPCPGAPIITGQPQSVVVESGGPAVQFNVNGAYIVNHQWRFNGEPISDGGPYSGATTSTLTVQPDAATEGAFDVLVSNPQGELVSQAAILAVTGSSPSMCPGDLNGDGVVGGADLGILLSAWGICVR